MKCKNKSHRPWILWYSFHNVFRSWSVRHTHDISRGSSGNLCWCRASILSRESSRCLGRHRSRYRYLQHRWGSWNGMEVEFCTGAEVVGCTVEANVPVGTAVDGTEVGVWVGADVVGCNVGQEVGEAVVGTEVGVWVGAEVVGCNVGPNVGEAMVGTEVGVWLGANTVGCNVRPNVGNTVNAVVNTEVGVWGGADVLGCNVGPEVGETVQHRSSSETRA